MSIRELVLDRIAKSLDSVSNAEHSQGVYRAFAVVVLTDLEVAGFDVALKSLMTAPWKVGRWPGGEYVDKPWYACDRGGWFGKGLPGRSFATHKEAMDYAVKMCQILEIP